MGADSNPLDRLRFPEPASIRDVWRHEASHFTPWLAKNLGVLDLLNLGRLECVGCEVTLPGTLRALDIQARTPTGETVAIENQYGRTDHDHMTRGLAYAIGLKARALVIIAEEHFGEFRAVADYMNRLAETSSEDEAIRIYLVEVAVESVAEYLVPRFRVIEQPNEWLKSAATVQPAPGHQSMEEFLQACPTGVRDVFRSVIEWWTDHPEGSARFGATLSMSLDRPHPARPSRPLSHLLLNTNGTFTVQRGYLRDAGVVTEDQVTDFDSMVQTALPNVTYAAKQYFLNSKGLPTLDGVKRFWSWLQPSEHADSTTA